MLCAAFRFLTLLSTKMHSSGLHCIYSRGEFLGPYLPRLKEYAAANNPFEKNAEYLHLSTLRRHTVPLGVALHFVTDFLEHI